MQKKSRKFISAFLTLALMLGLIFAMAIPANAADAQALAEQINKFAHGGDGTLTATAEGNTVIVTGSVSGATKSVDLNLDANVTLIWQANYSGEATYLFWIGGDGAFELPKGGSITQTGSIGGALRVTSNPVTISGGEIHSNGGGVSSSQKITIEMIDGLVETKGNCLNASGGEIHISGGLVYSTEGTAISGPVTISGGTVRSVGGVTIFCHDQGKATVTISGGLVENLGAHQTIDSDNIIITGGEVKNPATEWRPGQPGGASAVLVSGDLEIGGGVVSAGIGLAAYTNGVNYNINVRGGFVFAYGTRILTIKEVSNDNYERSVLPAGSANPTTVGGSAVVCAWNQAAGHTTYNAGTNDDLVVEPSGASATWDKVGDQSGISYANGSNTGFFPVEGVTVIVPPPTPVTANPTASTVYVDGTPTAFEAYNIDGSNYFKLRDLAFVLNGSQKQFAVGYDDITKAITLTTGEPYIIAGGELAAGDGLAKTAIPTPSKIYCDGVELNLTVYNIGGSNFFKLRDLMQVIDVYVGYDDATKAITLDTTRGYE